MHRLRKQKYHVIGYHSAVKKCLWVHNALVYSRFCYKCRFYGIESHRCIQMSPSVLWCWNSCLHCWRLRPQDVGLDSSELPRLPVVDEPSFIADMAIREHRRIVSGYKPRTSERMYWEAMNPKHVAISLTGEPTLYPRLSELVEEFRKRGLTTFLVTRGVRPDVIASLDTKPSQLYVSVEAYGKEMYNYFNRPLVANAWELTLKTLELLPTLAVPTVMRITLVRGFNIDDNAIRGFKRLIELAQPTYVETKAYMHVGGSTGRLSKDNMPSFAEVMDFARRLSREVGYDVVSYSVASRVALLSVHDKPVVRFGDGCPGGWGEAEEVEEGIGEYERVEDSI